MKLPVYEDLGAGIVCIDALYTGPGLACCYLIGDGGEYAFIETGTARSVPNILATLKALGVSLEQVSYIIPTHVHLDHAGGAGVLMDLCPAATLLIHPRGARHMIDPGRLAASARQVYGDEAFAELYGEVKPVSEERVRVMVDGTAVTLGSRTLRFEHTRGHAEHHFCIYDEQTNGWFSGDMFGVSYPGLRFAKGSFVMPATTPTQFDPTIYQESVRRLAASDPQCFYLTHYGSLPYAPDQADSLCRQLEAYADLGRSGPEESAALEARILEISVRELERLTTAKESAEAVGRLSVDATLNAQGIAWWRHGRAQQNEPA